MTSTAEIVAVHSITDPSSDAAETSKSNFPSLPKSKSSLVRLLTRIDAFLSHFNRCLSTPAGIDTVLLLICYPSRLAAAILDARHVERWVALVAGRTILLARDASGKTPIFATRLRALATLVSEARVILRLWGLLDMYFWARKLVVKTREVLAQRRAVRSSGDKDVAAAPPSLVPLSLSYAQLLTSTILQALENAAYLSSRGVLPFSPLTQGRMYTWSARCWAAYVGMELGKLAASEGKKGEEGRVWRNSLVRNLAWAPLTLHWSSEKGLVEEWAVGLLGTVPGLVQIEELWRSTVE